MNQIIEALREGSQPWVVLYLLGLGNLDYLLRVMLEQGKITQTYVKGRLWYSLPKPTPRDETWDELEEQARKVTREAERRHYNDTNDVRKVVKRNYYQNNRLRLLRNARERYKNRGSSMAGCHATSVENSLDRLGSLEAKVLGISEATTEWEATSAQVYGWKGHGGG